FGFYSSYARPHRTRKHGKTPGLRIREAGRSFQYAEKSSVFERTAFSARICAEESPSEQVALRPRPYQVQKHFLLVDLVNQQPVGRDMAFPAAAVVPDKRVVMVFLHQGLPCRQLLEHSRQQVQVTASFLGPFEVFLEPGRWAYLIHHRKADPSSSGLHRCRSCWERARLSSA